MNRFLPVLATAAITAAALMASASAAGAADCEAEPSTCYGIDFFATSLSDDQAGAHADLAVQFTQNVDETGKPFATTQSLDIHLPPGIAGNVAAFPRCAVGDLIESGISPDIACPIDSQLGFTEVVISGGGFGEVRGPVYNMEPVPGAVARLGFLALTIPTFIDIHLDPAGGYGLVASLEGLSGLKMIAQANTTLWGDPTASSHDSLRITPYEALECDGLPCTAPGEAPRHSSLLPTPFISSPTRCGSLGTATAVATSYAEPDRPSIVTAPLLPGLTGCDLLEFKPELSLKPTSEQAGSGSGLDAELTFPHQGLEHPHLLAEAHLRRAEVALPEGVTVNPSQAEGLGVCSPADYSRETATSGPNVGCPETSKIGSATAESPLIDEVAEGSLFVAKPYDNPFGSLLALYLILKIPERGVIVKIPANVVTDSETGRLLTIFDELPQLPVSSFKLHFREGARAPLVTPPSCGSFVATATFTSWSGKVVSTEPSFAITRGVNGSPCPAGDTAPPFHPGLIAGSLNNAAGSFSPFNVRLFRNDGEQEITHFSIKLPPGLLAKLAGIPLCTDQAIAAAAGRTGAEELAVPSCSPASEIGRTLAGAGVGQVLVYAPGKVYLAGPYHGSPVSIVAMTAAKVGPFDLGTVVVREALEIDPETAEVFIDATGSDPIPHIIQGIPVHLRDIRVYADRPEFALNPTGCDRTFTASTVVGSGSDFASEADDVPVVVSTPFQAADCAALPFKPKIRFRLRGGTNRGAHPSLRAHVKMKGIGEGAISRARVTLPRSEFLENAHIGTVCTRVQFRAGSVPGEQCPAASVYGRVKAVTPLLDSPLSGLVFLRSSEHRLPDLVATFHHAEIDIALVGRIDSFGKGQIRTTFETVPDAPVESVDFIFDGAAKGLLVNSTNLCKGKQRVKVELEAHNGKSRNYQTPLRANCGKKRAGSKRGS